MPKYQPIQRTSRFPSYPGIKPTRKELLKNLSTLDHLWNKGYLPDDLFKHYYLTTFAQNNGNVVRQAKALGLHRNTLITIYELKFGGKPSFGYRKKWQAIDGTPNISFQTKIHLFYRKIVKKPSFTATENKALVNLLLMKMPRKLFRTHFLLWAFRKGKTLQEIGNRLKRSPRHVSRLRKLAVKKNSLTEKWLYPLNPKTKDFYPSGRRK